MLVLLLAFIGQAYSYNCQCLVEIQTPLRNDTKEVEVLADYSVNDYATASSDDQSYCQEDCRAFYYRNFPSEELSVLLKDHSKDLIVRDELSYSCTTPTQVKYPVKVST